MINGPVDFVAVELKGGGLNMEIIGDLLELVNSGIVRIIDAVVVIKDEDGEVDSPGVGGARREPRLPCSIH